MIILGNKYKITQDEIEKISDSYQSFIQIPINHDTYKKLSDILSINSSNTIIILNLDKPLPRNLESYLEELEHDHKIKSVLFSDFASEYLHTPSLLVNEENLKSLLEIKQKPIHKMNKRIFDFIFSLFSILLSLPLMMIIALLIKIKSPEDSIFFTQKRLGLHGKPFRVLKFRTMIPNAEKTLNKMLREDKKIEEEYLKYRKLENDPRIIPFIGNFLRKSSLDELPQFFNVLLGDMSIVGPRPYIPEEFYKHTQTHIDIITSVKPGITGYWQVNDRNTTTFDGRVDSDILYIKSQNFWLDISIILKTFSVVLFRKGG